MHIATLTFRQSNRCNLSRFHWLTIEGNQKKGMYVYRDGYWTGSSTASVSNAKSMTSSWNNGELRQRYVWSIWLASLAVHEKNRWFRVTLRVRDLWGMLPLAHKHHMIRVVDIVKSAMRVPDISLLHDQRAKYTISDVSP